MSSEPTYRHEPLQSDEHIRVIALDPADSHDAPLQCNLLQLELDGARGEFEAISYTWGEPVFCVPLKCGDDAPHYITENLAQALRRFRDSEYPRLFWADAVCINQSDNEEKSKQVSRMGKIYSYASCTWVWLGEVDEATSSMAVSLCRKIGAEWASYGLSSPTPFASQDIYHEQHQKKRAELLENSRENLTFWEMLYTPWFRRLWCVQEIVLAQNVELHWGSNELPWQTFAEALSVVKSVGADSRNARTLRSWIDGMLPDIGVPCWFHPITLVAIRYQYQGLCGDGVWKRESLPALRKILYLFGCKDPRDQVYAILGMCEDLAIVADYSEPYEEMLQRLARSLLQAGQLSFLHLTRNLLSPAKKAEHGLPSYATFLLDGLEGALPLGGKAEQMFAAATKESPSVSFSPAGAPIIQGYLCDKVRTVVFNGSAGQIRYMPSFVHAIETAMHRHPPLQSVKRTGDSWYMALGKTILVDCAFRNTHCWRGMPFFFREILPLILAESANPAFLLLLEQDYDAQRMCVDKYFAPLGEWAGEDMSMPSEDVQAVGWRLAREFLLRAAVVTHQRDFIVTGDGYMGIVPQGTEIGDVVCVFSGSDTPFILRPVEVEGGKTVHHIVGDCYVHGLMEGEVFDMSEIEKTGIELI